ncbi:unnamed protein product [Malus baccata var. baccata]
MRPSRHKPVSSLSSILVGLILVVTLAVILLAISSAFSSSSSSEITSTVAAASAATGDSLPALSSAQPQPPLLTTAAAAPAPAPAPSPAPQILAADVLQETIIQKVEGDVTNYTAKKNDDVANGTVFISGSQLDKVEASLGRARSSIREAALVRNKTSTHQDPDYVPRGPIYRNPNAFHRSYLEMEKVFKIYVYEEGEVPIFHDGPCRSIYSSEGRFIHEMEKGKMYRTKDPHKALVYFLPFSVVNMVQYIYMPETFDRSGMKRAVVDYINLISHKHPFWNRSLGADHFMLSCHDWGPTTTSSVPDLFHNSIRVLCNANTSEGFNPLKDASFPEINLKTSEMPGIGGQPPSKRSTLAFFAGRLHGHIRYLLLNEWKGKDQDVQVYDQLPRRVSYENMLKSSKFCLCPSGYEVASPRVVEAIYAECVPVLISDGYVPPFSDVLNWKSFSVQIPVKNISDIKTILTAISSRHRNKPVSSLSSILVGLILVLTLAVSLLVISRASSSSSSSSSSSETTWKVAAASAGGSSDINTTTTTYSHAALTSTQPPPQPLLFSFSSLNNLNTANSSPAPAPAPQISAADVLQETIIQKVEGDVINTVDNDVVANRTVFISGSQLDKVEASLGRARSAIREAAKVRNKTSTHQDPDYVPRGPIYHNPNAFHRSYLEMEKVFKIYVYEEGEVPIFHEGPCRGIYSSEGRFIHEMEKGKFYRTKDPHKALVYFLPFSVVTMVEYIYMPETFDRSGMKLAVVDYINLISHKHPFWNRSHGADHFMLSCHDWGPYTTSFVPDLFHNSIRILCNANTTEGFNPSKDASLPEINLKTSEMSGIGGQPPSKRSTLAFFAGGLHGHIRYLLLNEWKGKDQDVLVYDKLPKGVSYENMLRSSKFCLCPSGYEVASPRVVEAIYAECVPVLISDGYVPPFSDVLNWNSFSVQVPVKNISDIKTILTAISSREYLRMQRKVKQVQRHFLVNGPPKRYDVFHMIVHSIWLRRLNIRIQDVFT